MPEDTRKLLKVFGVAVTDFEAEAQRLVEQTARLDTASADEVRTLLSGLARALADVQGRWLEVTTHLANLERELLERVALAR